MLRITAWVLRFVENIKAQFVGKDFILTSYLNQQEICNSKNVWLRANQRGLIFKDNFKDLENALRLKLGEDGLYRAIGRLNKGQSLPYSLREPILLNRDHELTRLIVRRSFQSES